MQHPEWISGTGTVYFHQLQLLKWTVIFYSCLLSWNTAAKSTLSLESLILTHSPTKKKKDLWRADVVRRGRDPVLDKTKPKLYWLLSERVSIWPLEEVGVLGGRRQWTLWNVEREMAKWWHLTHLNDQSWTERWAWIAQRGKIIAYCRQFWFFRSIIVSSRCQCPRGVTVPPRFRD